MERRLHKDKNQRYQHQLENVDRKIGNGRRSGKKIVRLLASQQGFLRGIHWGCVFRRKWRPKENNDEEDATVIPTRNYLDDYLACRDAGARWKKLKQKLSSSLNFRQKMRLPASTFGQAIFGETASGQTITLDLSQFPVKRTVPGISDLK